MEAYLGEIRLFAGYKEPEGWVPCDGRLLAIENNEALYSLVGTTYGGDGLKDFGVPNLVGRIPIGAGVAQSQGATYFPGTQKGVREESLGISHLPSHTHPFKVSSKVATKTVLDANLSETFLAAPDTPNDILYTKPGATFATSATFDLDNNVIGPSGQEKPKPHSNMMPTFALRYLIAITGNYPDLND